MRDGAAQTGTGTGTPADIAGNKRKSCFNVAVIAIFIPLPLQVLKGTVESGSWGERAMTLQYSPHCEAAPLNLTPTQRHTMTSQGERGVNTFRRLERLAGNSVRRRLAVTSQQAKCFINFTQRGRGEREREVAPPLADTSSHPQTFAESINWVNHCTSAS